MTVTIWKIRLFLWVILLGIVFWLFWMAIVPSGKIIYINDFTKPSEFIQKLTPEERVEPISNGTQKIIGDPVYFSLRTPRRFEKAKFIIKYKNESNWPIIEIGSLVDKVLWQYDLKPVENKILDQLSLVWDIKREGDIMLLQRNGLNATSTYLSVNDFLDNLPDLDKIAVYNYDLDYEYIIEDYKPSEEEQNIDYSIRGPFSFYTYIKDENLNFDFSVLDINQNKDKDDIILNLYYDGELIDSVNLEDDGVSGEDIYPHPSRKRNDIRNIKIESKGLPEGVYRIEMKVNDDIVTKNIKTTQSKIAFINKLWIYSDNGTNISLFTDSRKLNAQTVNPGNLQNIDIKYQISNISNDNLSIGETYKLFSIDLDSGVKEVMLEKDDVIVSGNGVFSFSKDGLFNPKIKIVDASLDINNDNVDYILARYNFPKKENGWKVAEVNLDFANAYREFYKNSILISVPGIRLDDEIEDYVELDEIQVELEGTSLWEKISKMF